jgi:hypothetical protein
LQNVQNTTSLLVRVMIGKVENLERLITILRSIPVIQDDLSWRASLDDDLVQESVSASKAADGHNDNGE